MMNTTPTPNPPSPKTPIPSVFRRIPLAIGAFFRILSDGQYAARVDALSQPQPPAAPVKPTAPVPPAPVPPAPVAPAPLKMADHDSALQLLGLLQREARLIDFTQEDLSSYSDADIGGAARVVHEGCCKVLREHFTLTPVRPEIEGSPVTLNKGFDTSAIRLTGHVVGQAPFQGTLTHRGWLAAEVHLPQLAPRHDARVLAQAEVEL